jgi:outer membrane protein assembly factor BamB
LIQKGLAVGIVLLFLGSSIVTMMVPAEQQEPRTRSPYDCYHRSDTISTPLPVYVEDKAYDTLVTREASQTSDDGLMNSSWPMYCHDSHHSGRSPFNTSTDILDNIKWSFNTNDVSFYGSTIIGPEGIIYTAANDLFAICPNGTLKWKFIFSGWCESCPAMDENGIIYIGTSMGDPNYFYAIYPNGTMKWRYWIGGIIDIKSSPVIGTDGTIYFSCGGDYPPIGYISALYPNGTLKWSYQTNHVVYSSPAIGNDGTIYCGSHDTYLYALYPNNGTMKWRYKTGDWIRTSPCIGDDDTIYCASWDGYLYALFSNGTLKWCTYVESGTSPTLGLDGTIYSGYNHLYAINPVNGSVIWIFNIGGYVLGSTPCHSHNGTIYFGTSNSGYFIAVNPNGTEAGRKYIGPCESSPAIDSDGTIYVGSMDENGVGYLNAFGSLNINAPTAPTIIGRTNGKIQKTYTYKVTSTSPLNHNIFYLIDWGDGTTTDWLGPYNSGTPLTLNHSWRNKGTYLIQARAKDTQNLWGPWGTLSVTMPCSYETPFQQFWIKVFERFPNVFPFLRHLLKGYQ